MFDTRSGDAMNNRRVLTCDQIRRVDQVAIEQWGIPGVVLMENAGRGVVDVMCELGVSGPVVIACAKGNNGGDGIVMARHLHLRGIEVQVLLAGNPADLAGDAAWNFDFLRRTSVPVCEWCPTSGTQRKDQLERAEWLVDALLGTGAQGAPREPVASLIREINGCRGKKLAVDVPSGLDARTGQPYSPTFKADHTCTFVAEKTAFESPAARPYLGDVRTLDIGLPWEMVLATLEG